MSKAVLISIQPKWCEKIANGAKTIEVRKTRPKLETPFKCYIYCTNGGRPLVYGDVLCANGWRETYTQTYGYSRKNAEEIWEVMNGKVIGEFICDEVESIDVPYPAYSDKLDKRIIEQSQVPYYALHKYAYHDTIYGWHISDLVIYDKPKKLSEFRKPCVYGDDENMWCFECDKSGYTPDMHIDCYNILTRPPQSWCYVEELNDSQE